MTHIATRYTTITGNCDLDENKVWHFY